MFSQGSRITDYSIFQAGGLKNADQVVFARKNLIIGKNGSGKTRFLKALEQEKKTQNKKEIAVGGGFIRIFPWGIDAVLFMCLPDGY